jgi:maleamate amidohydrolase
MPPRVWDRFLTERDKAVLGRPGGARQVFGVAPALLLIDLYRWVFGDAPEPIEQARRSWPGSCGLAAWEALPPTQALLGVMRQLHRPVIHTTGMPTGRSARQTAAETGDPRMAERVRHRYDIVEQVAPVEGELVIRKGTPSPFWACDLAGTLRAQGIDTLLVAGESTSGCVRATVVDGFSHGFQVVVVEDCVFDRAEASHALNLFDMHQKYATVVPLAEVVDYLRRLGPRASAAIEHTRHRGESR